MPSAIQNSWCARPPRTELWERPEDVSAAVHSLLRRSGLLQVGELLDHPAYGFWWH